VTIYALCAASQIPELKERLDEMAAWIFSISKTPLRGLRVKM
jgi:hypothetical protein